MNAVKASYKFSGEWPLEFVHEAEQEHVGVFAPASSRTPSSVRESAEYVALRGLHHRERSRVVVTSTVKIIRSKSILTASIEQIHLDRFDVDFDQLEKCVLLFDG